MVDIINQTSETVMVNITEELVKQIVDEKIGEFDVCDCEVCRLNVCALALNNLPSQYVTTAKGALFVKVDDSTIINQAKLYVEVAKAFMTVKENPRH